MATNTQTASSTRISSHKSKSSRGAGLATREVRARVKAADSKSARDALLLEKRRIPLSEVQEEQPKKKKDKQAESELRLKRLREWRAKRDATKEKEKAMKKKPFSHGGKLTTTTSNATVCKPRSTRVTTNQTAKPVKTGAKEKVPVGCEQASKDASVMGKNAEPKTDAIEPKASEQKTKATEPKGRGGKRATATDMVKQPRASPTATRASKRIASKTGPKNEAGSSAQAVDESKNDVPGKTAPTRGRKGGRAVEEKRTTARVTRSSVARVTASTKDSGKPTEPQRKEGVKKIGKKRVNTAQSSGKKRVKCDSTPEVKTKLHFSDTSLESTSPSALPSFLSHSSQLPPSPVHTTSPSYPEQNTAWISVQHVSSRHAYPPPASAIHNIDDILGPCTFSPFKFTAGQATPAGPSQSKKRWETPGKPFTFGFRIPVAAPQTPSSLQAVTGSSRSVTQSGNDVTLDTMSVDSLDCAPTPSIVRPSPLPPRSTLAENQSTSNEVPIPLNHGETEETIDEQPIPPLSSAPLAGIETTSQVKVVALRSSVIQMEGEGTSEEEQEAEEMMTCGENVAEENAEITADDEGGIDEQNNKMTGEQAGDENDEKMVAGAVQGEELSEGSTDTEEGEAIINMVCASETANDTEMTEEMAVDGLVEGMNREPTAEDVKEEKEEGGSVVKGEEGGEGGSVVKGEEGGEGGSAGRGEEGGEGGSVGRGEEAVGDAGPLGVEAWCGGVVSGVGGEKEEDAQDGDTENNGVTISGHGTDYTYFHRLHDDVKTRLTTLCSPWRDKGVTLETLIQSTENQDDITHLPEVVDRVRVVVGQAELLMRKKMKQYLGLVTGAEEQTDGGTTTAEDLQGFFDLVTIQVEDVEQKFRNLEELETNGWKQAQVQPATKNKRRGKKRPPPKSAKTGDKVSERQAAAREKHNAMRSRLKEMKMAAVASRANTTTGEKEDVLNEELTKDTVTTTPDDQQKAATPHPEDGPSGSKRKSTPVRTPSDPSSTVASSGGSKRRSTAGKKRRRSRRLSRRSSVALIDLSEDPVPTEPSTPPSSSPTPSLNNPSVFSPTPSFHNSSSDSKPSSEVPTANLFSFTAQPPPPQQHTVNIPPLKSPLMNWLPKGSRRTPSIKHHTVTTSNTTAANDDGASVRRFVSVTPSKRVREIMEADVIMSPARRSLRLAGKCDSSSGCHGNSSHGNYQVSSLKELPDGLDIGYLPNKALS